jgi:hypothetical protein
LQGWGFSEMIGPFLSEKSELRVAKTPALNDKDSQPGEPAGSELPA